MKHLDLDESPFWDDSDFQEVELSVLLLEIIVNLVVPHGVLLPQRLLDCLDCHFLELPFQIIQSEPRVEPANSHRPGIPVHNRVELDSEAETRAWVEELVPCEGSPVKPRPNQIRAKETCD